MLIYDPEKRPNVAECLKHEWFKKEPHIPTQVSQNKFKKRLVKLSEFKTEKKLQQAALGYIANYFITKRENQ